MCFSSGSLPAVDLEAAAAAIAAIAAERPERLRRRSAQSREERHVRRVTGLLNRITDTRLNDLGDALIREVRSARAAAHESESAAADAASAIASDLVDLLWEYSVRSQLYRRVMAEFCVQVEHKIADIDGFDDVFLPRLLERAQSEVGTMLDAASVPDAAAAARQQPRLLSVALFLGEVFRAGGMTAAAMHAVLDGLLATAQARAVLREACAEVAVLVLSAIGECLSSREVKKKGAEEAAVEEEKEEEKPDEVEEEEEEEGGVSEGVLHRYVDSLLALGCPKVLGVHAVVGTPAAAAATVAPPLGARLSFLLLDLAELRARGWVPREMRAAHAPRAPAGTATRGGRAAAAATATTAGAGDSPPDAVA
eukprot:Rhum_TRINITY_DN15279_c12_g1::Rhum_TRINITY_DN15279_c12_g1_i1::g.147744::m.147744